jgi:hypothetical protein
LAAEYRAVHWVLGHPVRVTSNHPVVMEQAARSFGRWSPSGDGAAPEIRLEVHVAGDDDAPLADPVFTVDPGGVFELRLGEHHGRSDAASGRVRIRVTPALLRHPDVLRHTFLEGMTLWPLSHRDRCPLHAAALAEGGRALLLSGPSGSGKSTLAYAAVRAGLQLLAEDTVYVETGPPVRVWGLPGFLHLLPDAARFFPELHGREPAVQPNGELKIPVDLRATDGVPALPWAERAGICLVARGPELIVERIGADETAASVAGNSAGGFGYFADRLRAAVEAIGAGGCWRMVVPPEPSRAVPALREMISSL